MDCRALPLLLMGLIGSIAVDASTAPAAETPKPPLRLVSDPWPPFTGEEGSPQVAIDLVQRALNRATRPSTSTILAGGFVQILERIRNGEYDGSAALWKTPERESFLVFSAPYLENRLVLVGREGSPVDARSMADLKGKRVATVAAYAYGNVIRSNVGPELVPGESDVANLRSLLAGQVDYVLADELLVHHLFQAQAARAEGALEVGRFPLVSRTLHFALRKDLPGAQEIIAQFDEQIRAMMADGAYHRALALDWIWADINGDGVAELVLGGIQAGVSPPQDGYEVISADRPATSMDDEEKDGGFVIEGVRYEDWEHVPERYKVDIDRTREPLDPGVTLFRF